MYLPSCNLLKQLPNCPRTAVSTLADVELRRSQRPRIRTILGNWEIVVAFFIFFKVVLGLDTPLCKYTDNKCYGRQYLKSVWGLRLPPYEILSRPCDLCRKNLTKEEVELFIAEYSLKSAWIAPTDRSNGCASDLGVACDPGGLLPWVCVRGSCQCHWNSVLICNHTRGLRPTVIFNF